MASGAAAAEAASRASREPEGVARAHRHYRALLDGSFVLQDHRRVRQAPGPVVAGFVQRVQPGLVCDVAESFFTVVTPAPKPGLVRTLRRTMRARKIRLSAALRSALATFRLFSSPTR